MVINKGDMYPLHCGYDHVVMPVLRYVNHHKCVIGMFIRWGKNRSSPALVLLVIFLSNNLWSPNKIPQPCWDKFLVLTEMGHIYFLATESKLHLCYNKCLLFSKDWSHNFFITLMWIAEVHLLIILRLLICYRI